MLSDEISYGATLAVLHGDIDSDVFLIDFEVKVFENVDIVHTDKGIDLLDDVFLFFGGDRRE